MPNRLKLNQLTAELSTVNSLLASLPAGDVLGRIGLQSKRDEIVAAVEQLRAETEIGASVALMFAGRPVIGSQGIEAGFASDAVSKFQDLITNVWATNNRPEVGARGPVADREHSKLHITSLLHGSVGFLLEELADEGRLFPTALKQAADRAAEVIEAFASPDEQVFVAALETVDQRVLSSTRDFFRQIYRNGAVVKLVEGERDLELAGENIERAFQRAENAAIEEEEVAITGQLLGLIPIGRRFELRDENGNVIAGTVAATLSEEYLQRLTDEDLVGNRCRAVVRRKRITRFGRTTESILLLDLDAAPLQR